MISKRRTPSILVLLVLISIAGVVPAMAQVSGDSRSGEPGPSSVPGVERPSFGTGDRILYRVGDSEFSPVGSTIPYSEHMGRYTNTAGGTLKATPHLPSGAILTYLELDYCDTSAQDDVNMSLSDCHFLGDSCRATRFISSDEGFPGCSYVWLDMTPYNWTIDNNTRKYELRAATMSGTSQTQILGAYIGYKLQVSAAPATATFTDVPTTHSMFRFVEALTRAGISAGCGGGNFCPNQPLTRGQMAVFLSVALGLHFPN